MGITVVYEPSSGEFDNTIPIVDGGGTYTNSSQINGQETKPLLSDIVEFAASSPDVQASLVTTASGMPPGVSGVDEGSGVLHLEGTPSTSIIPTFPLSIYDKENPATVSTGGTPSSYTLNDQVNIYVEFSVEVTCKHKATKKTTLSHYIIKDWNEEKDNMLAYVAETWPE